MEFTRASVKALQYKVAISLTIIRNKPVGMTLDEFIKLLTSNFCKSYTENRKVIEHLKSVIHELKKELFQLENSALLSDLSNVDLNEPGPSQILEDLNKKITEQNEDKDYVDKLIANVEFISNVVKLKSLGKDFKLNEKNNEIILECLIELFKQIDYFLFQDKLKLKEAEEANMLSSFSQISFPIESILHALQIFINIFEIEWFYYLRDNLIFLINTFLRDLVKYLMEYPGYMEQNGFMNLKCCSQILIILSTSDYLVNTVFFHVIEGLQEVIDHVCHLNQEIESNPNCTNNTARSHEIQNCLNNCKYMANCLELLIKIRSLENYTPLSNQLKSKVNYMLNSIFIKLTDSVPFMAIEISKLIQMLAF